MEENIHEMKQLTKDESPKYISSLWCSLSKHKQPNQKRGGGGAEDLKINISPKKTFRWANTGEDAQYH